VPAGPAARQPIPGRHVAPGQVPLRLTSVDCELLEVPSLALDRPLLNDPDEPPDDLLLSRHLGPAKAAWDDFASGAPAVVDGAEMSWRYYRDGKAWLCKVARKGRTICWISVWQDAFKATFYFGEKAVADIPRLDIDASLRQAFVSSTRVGKLRPLRVEVRDGTHLADLYTLMRYKVVS
jgi:hypothetical protein